MTDPPTYRVEPDPGFADRLERLLLQELAAGPDVTGLGRRAARIADPIDTDIDSDDQQGDLIMLETEDRRMAHEPPTPVRRAPGRWLLVAAAAACVALVGTLVVAAADDDDEKVDVANSTPTTTPVLDAMALPEGTTDYEPGRYFIDPDGDESTPLRVTFQVTSEGWAPWLGAYKFRDDALSSFSITTVTNLETHGCTAHYPRDPAVGPSVDDLATALTQLAPFVVSAPPTDVTLFGYSGKHLELTVPDLGSTGTGDDRRYSDCDGGELRSWISPVLQGSFWGYSGVAGLSEEFWILDVEGTRLVLVKLDNPAAPAQDVAERDAMFDSIRIEP